MAELAKAINMAVRTGKVLLGSRSTIKAAKLGKAKLIVVAENCPAHIRSDIEYYARLSGIPVVEFKGSSWDLGQVCGKPFMVAALAIRDPGLSKIMELVGLEGEEVE
ncbi:MAG TPA: 50S ribosomal protein L30e [Candidatus Bathyarchaeota archaeon]|nr:50S ribosomal protein L30e [Candidatus Bathyarchaeota archaeon]